VQAFVNGSECMQAGIYTQVFATFFRTCSPGRFAWEKRGRKSEKDEMGTAHKQSAGNDQDAFGLACIGDEQLRRLTPAKSSCISMYSRCTTALISLRCFGCTSAELDENNASIDTCSGSRSGDLA
jgi:hypothetical protein